MRRKTAAFGRDHILSPELYLGDFSSLGFLGASVD